MSSQDKRIVAGKPARRIPRWKVVLFLVAAVCFALFAGAGYGYWKYATVTDRYIDAGVASGPLVRVTYDQLPTLMVDTILSAEDPDFFSRSVLKDYANHLLSREDQMRAGITFYLARIFCSGTETLTLNHLILEIAVAVRLDGRFSKEQVFELYANRVYLGRSREGSELYGLAAASHSYFNRDIRDLTLPEMALLAGLIERPNYYSPFQNPVRALACRDRVLDKMRSRGKVSIQEYDEMKALPLGVVSERERPAQQ